MNAEYLIKLVVVMNGVKMKALLDLGSLVNYILGSAALRAGLRPLRKIDLYQLYVVNGVEML
jgi:hypothetical protein